MELNRQSLCIDLAAEESRIAAFIRTQIVGSLRKKGAVVAVSGGIDSSTTAALCARALGPENVFALLLPERDSSSDSTRYGRKLVHHLGIPHELVDISPILDVMGCYRYRDESIRELFPEYTSEYRNKIVMNGGPQSKSRINFFSVVIEGPEGLKQRKRLPLRNYLQIVAATNMKQRTRKSLEYFHADRLNFAVVGTPNLLEYDQGFFVKLGDGSADLKPIAHLYKTQVYAMAHHLNLPKDLCDRKPTTDTYSLEQTQEEFYFQLPFETLDLLLYGLSLGVSADVIAESTGLTQSEVQLHIEDIQQKRRTTAPLHQLPVTLLHS